jgi:hypothetical protein
MAGAQFLASFPPAGRKPRLNLSGIETQSCAGGGASTMRKDCDPHSFQHQKTMEHANAEMNVHGLRGEMPCSLRNPESRQWQR